MSDKAIISFSGDLSVGIQPSHFDMELPFPLKDLDTENRELFRNDIQKLYATWGDDFPCCVLFNDECGGCRKVSAECTCPKDETP